MQPMKRTFRSAIWPLLGLLTVACAAPDGRNLPAAEDFESLSAQFAAPSKEYGSAPLFVWNKVVTPERIDEAMADLKDKGFGGVFVHPRPGMVTQYLDDNWVLALPPYDGEGPRTGHERLDLRRELLSERFRGAATSTRRCPRATTRAWRSNTCVPGCCPIRSTASSAACDVKATPSPTLRPKPFRGVAKRAITTSSTRLTTPRRRGTAASRTWI